DPSAEELREIVGKATEEGAFGVKILGGHVPLTPDATRRAIRAAADAGAYCAVHAGTTENGSDIKGLEELVALADGLPLHVAHVNSYCRGQVTGDAVDNWEELLPVIGKTPGRLYLPNDLNEDDLTHIHKRFNSVGYALPKKVGYYDSEAPGHFTEYPLSTYQKIVIK
ncbi:hypothetical protein, partial [Thioalkalivibrio sp.]|uniref:hypothetical protein n=1 Tax=Thioalkalivibrio sp. TaxID=2093813 RepID=UPI003975EA08